MNENYQANENGMTAAPATRPYGNSNQINVSTSMVSMWDSITGAQLKLSILNNGLGVAIWLPFVNPDGSRKYPTEYRNNVVVSQKNAIAVERAINDIILPAYEKGVNAHSGIFTNNARSSMLEIEVKDGEFYLAIHKNCDPVTRIPKDTVRFKFESASIINGFDPVSGEMEVVPIQADFFVFCKAIFAYNDLSAGSVAAHGTALASAYINRKFMDYIRSIADAVHAQLPAPVYQSYGGFNSRQNSMGVQNNFNIDNPANNSLPQIAATEVATLSDLVG